MNSSPLNLQTKADGPQSALSSCNGEIPMKRTCLNIAGEVDSRQPRRSHFGSAIISDGKEIQTGSLEMAIPSKVNQRCYNPIAYHLEKIEWSVFGTITFKNDAFTFDNALSEELRKCECRRLIAIASTRLRLRQRRLLYYGKSEWGANFRGHYNFLIGKEGTESVEPADLAQLMQNLWTGGMYPLGTAKIDTFRPSLHKAGIRYQSKKEYDSCGNLLNNSEMFSYILWKRLTENAANNN